VPNALQELLRCQEDFFYFVDKYIKINHPARGVIPFQLYDYQKRLFKFYQEERYGISIKFRQGGFTTFSVVYALWLAMFHDNQKILFLSKTDREAVHMGNIVDLMLKMFEPWFSPKLEKNQEHIKVFSLTNSSIAFFTPDAARGRSLTHLFIDEAAFIPHIEKHWKALYPIVASGGKVFVNSTVNGVGNWFEQTYHSAEKGENNFKIFKSNYKEHPDYSNPEWVKKTREALGEKGWLQEVEGCFVGSLAIDYPLDVFKNLSNNELVRKLWAIFPEKKLKVEQHQVLYEASRRLYNQN